MVRELADYERALARGGRHRGAPARHALRRRPRGLRPRRSTAEAARSARDGAVVPQLLDLDRARTASTSRTSTSGRSAAAAASAGCCCDAGRASASSAATRGSSGGCWTGTSRRAASTTSLGASALDRVDPATGSTRRARWSRLAPDPRDRPRRTVRAPAARRQPVSAAWTSLGRAAHRERLTGGTRRERGTRRRHPQRRRRRPVSGSTGRGRGTPSRSGCPPTRPTCPCCAPPPPASPPGWTSPSTRSRTCGSRSTRPAPCCCRTPSRPRS